MLAILSLLRQLTRNPVVFVIAVMILIAAMITSIIIMPIDTFLLSCILLGVLDQLYIALQTR